MSDIHLEQLHAAVYHVHLHPCTHENGNKELSLREPTLVAEKKVEPGLEKQD